MKKTLTVALAAAGAGVLLAGCGGAETAPTLSIKVTDSVPLGFFRNDDGVECFVGSPGATMTVRGASGEILGKENIGDARGDWTSTGCEILLSSTLTGSSDFYTVTIDAPAYGGYFPADSAEITLSSDEVETPYDWKI